MIDFSWIFHRFSTPKSIKNLSKINPKINPKAQEPKYQKSIKNLELSTILATSAMPCWGKKSIKINPKSITKQLSNQHPNLHRFWSQLGSILGGFGEPTWSQNRCKIDPKSCANKDCKTGRHRELLNVKIWSLLASNLAPKTAGFRSKWGDTLRRNPCFCCFAV